jgi:hypothetical protein
MASMGRSDSAEEKRVRVMGVVVEDMLGGCCEVGCGWVVRVCVKSRVGDGSRGVVCFVSEWRSRV